VINGIFKIVIGLSFFTLRIITTIHDEGYKIMQYHLQYNVGGTRSGLFNMRFIYDAESYAFNEVVYSYSPFPYIIGLLFILWGVYTLKEAKHERIHNSI
jgi:hypothetical protein